MKNICKHFQKNLLSGEDVQLPEKSLRDIFKFSNLGQDDIFFHLGCNNEKGIEIAINEFKVRKAVGIDNSLEKIQNAQKKTLKKKKYQHKINSSKNRGIRYFQTQL